MCCLKYEADTYEKARAGLPKEGARVETAEGFGKVVGVNVLRGSVRVKLQDGSGLVELSVKELRGY